MANVSSIKLPDNTVVNIKDDVSGYVTTDENLKTTALSVGSSMYLIGGSSSESTGTKLTDGALQYTRYLSGRCWLSIGKASTEGILRLYNAKSGAVYTTLRPNADITTSNTIYLPGLDGTLALTSNIPTKTSDLTNDSGFITSYTETDPVFSASAAAGITSSDISNWNGKSNFSGDYNDLSNKPSIPTYSEISEANIKQGSSSTVGLITGRRARQAVETYSPVTDVTVDGVSVLEGTSADIDLTGKSDVGHTHTVSAITDFPTIPENTSDLINNSGFITSSDIPVTDVTVGGTSILDGTVAKFTALETFTGTVGSSMQDGYLCGVYDPNNKVVTIHFACRSTANIATRATLFTIPAKYRPPSAVTVPMLIYTSSTFAGYQGSLSTSGILTQSWSGSARGAFGSCSYKI